MDKLEVGMYVRTRWGIAKVTSIYEKNIYVDRCFQPIDETMCFKEDIIGEPSHNIIDLIKHKDIILGKDGKLYQCWKVYKDYVFTYSKNKQGQTITLVDYQIDKVLCYEQFESMSYRIGD